MSFFSGKKLILLGFILVLLAVIPITVYFLQTQTTQTQTKATPATTLYFALTGQTTQTTKVTKTVGDSIDLDVIMNPGSNEIIATTLYVTYDQTKLQIKPNGFAGNLIQTAGPGQGFTQYLSEPKFTPPGSAQMTMAIGLDSPRTIKTTQKIASISFTAIDAAVETKVAFDSAKSNVTSSVDQEVSVLSSAQPVSIAIASASATPTPTLAGPTATPSASPTTNRVPICSALNIDRTASGSAPFSLTFTAIGSDADGNITKATFDFADGPTQDILSTGGLGTNSVNVQVAHTYQNAGTFKATAILTDDKGGVSTASDNCSKILTITSASGSASPSPVLETPTETPSPTAIAQITTSPPGPGGEILGIGFLGLGLILLGGIVFLIL